MNIEVKISKSRISYKKAMFTLEKRVEDVKKGLKKGIPSDLLSVDLKQAINHLGEITGEVTNDEILSKIKSTY